MARRSSTRVPGSIFGENPTAPVNAKPDDAAETSETRKFIQRRQTDVQSANIRFTTKGAALYAIFLGWPDGPVTIKSLAKARLPEGRDHRRGIARQYGKNRLPADGEGR